LSISFEVFLLLRLFKGSLRRQYLLFYSYRIKAYNVKVDSDNSFSEPFLEL